MAVAIGLSLVAFFTLCPALSMEKLQLVSIPWTDPSTWFDPQTHDPTKFMYTLLVVRKPASVTRSSIRPSSAYWIAPNSTKTNAICKVWPSGLLFFQWIPLFILPEIILPWAGRNGAFVEGAMMRPVADIFFSYDQGLGVDRAYWRAYGFILAWRLWSTIGSPTSQ